MPSRCDPNHPTPAKPATASSPCGLSFVPLSHFASPPSLLAVYSVSFPPHFRTALFYPSALAAAGRESSLPKSQSPPVRRSKKSTAASNEATITARALNQVHLPRALAIPRVPGCSSCLSHHTPPQLFLHQILLDYLEGGSFTVRSELSRSAAASRLETGSFFLDHCPPARLQAE